MERRPNFCIWIEISNIPSPIPPKRSSSQSIMLVELLRGCILWRQLEILWLESSGKIILSKGPRNKAIADIWLVHLCRTYPLRHICVYMFIAAFPDVTKLDVRVCNFSEWFTGPPLPVSIYMSCHVLVQEIWVIILTNGGKNCNFLLWRNGYTGE